MKHRAFQRRTRLCSAMIGVIAALLVSCSASDTSVADTTSTTSDVDRGPDFIPLATDVVDGGSSDEGLAESTDDSTSTVAGNSDPTTGAIPAVAENGVPGIDSDDRFCRAWSEFAGSFQALTLAAALGEPAVARQLEVIAAPAVAAAVVDLGTHLPSELDSERQSLVDSFAGPFARRAASALEALSAAGLEDQSMLIDLWLSQLAANGTDNPEFEIELPAEIDGDALATATLAFSNNFPSIIEDPSLITDASIPLTDAYLLQNCPDRGVLSGNDIVNDGG